MATQITYPTIDKFDIFKDEDDGTLTLTTTFVSYTPMERIVTLKRSTITETSDLRLVMKAQQDAIVLLLEGDPDYDLLAATPLSDMS